MSLNIGYEIQKQIYATLTGDVTLMGLINGVYDHVPQSEGFAFIRLGTATYADQESQSSTGFTGSIQIDCWTRDQNLGTAPAHAILTRVRDLLHNTDIWAITGYCMINFREVFRDVVAEADTATYHGVVRYNLNLGGNTTI